MIMSYVEQNITEEQNDISWSSLILQPLSSSIA